MRSARTDQGLTGDGLVAFEEYRGFFIMGTHTRTTTETKDVFAGIDGNAGGLISVQLGFFDNLAGFNVHEIQATTPPIEWDGTATRFVNSQRAGIPGATDQRALRVVRNDTLQDAAGNPSFGITNEIPGQLTVQSPNETDYIEVNVQYHYSGLYGTLPGTDGVYGTPDDTTRALTAAEANDALRETVGHECGHGVHIEHNWIVGDEHQFAEGHGEPDSNNITTGPDGVCDTAAVGNDVQLIPVGQGTPGSVIITDGGDGLDAGTLLFFDDIIVGDNVVSGPDGIAQSTAGANDVQAIPVGQGSPNTVIITDGGDGIDSGTLVQGDDVINGNTVTSGPDGVAQSTASGNDVQVILVGHGSPGSIIVTGGSDGVNLGTNVLGDDLVAGNTVISGPDGIAQSTAGGNDVQAIPVGQGLPNQPAVSTGADGISDSVGAGDDVQRIPLGNGEPYAIGITAGPDGVLQATPWGDDTVIALPAITTGPDGILDTYSDAPAYGVPSIMTSDLLLPIPNTYKSDELDQVRFHLKHP